MKPMSDQQSEKLSEKLKNMVKMFPTAGSILGNRISQTNRTSTGGTDYSAFDVNGLNRRPIEECDQVFIDCTNFLVVAKETIQFTQNANPASAPTIASTLGLNVRTKINKWRAKRKGNHLFLMFEALQERIEASESQLTALSGESQRNISSLVLQSLHLKARLKACVDHNRSTTEDMKPVIQTAQGLLEHFEAQEHGLHAMLVFFDEVAELAKHQPYVPWGLRTKTSGAVAHQGGNGTEGVDVEVTREALVKRLNRIKRVSGCCVSRTVFKRCHSSVAGCRCGS